MREREREVCKKAEAGGADARSGELSAVCDRLSLLKRFKKEEKESVCENVWEIERVCLCVVLDAMPQVFPPSCIPGDSGTAQSKRRV